MCGIAGFVDFSLATAEPILIEQADGMARAIAHRGPDHRGLWVDPRLGVALAHQRLSIIDRSAAGHQPMHSSDQRYVMVYNGEIYNFKVLRRLLVTHGLSFQGESDSEVLLAAFLSWGIEATLAKLNGMFAVVLLDRLTRIIYLIRDRMGQKPLYYAQQGRFVFFASELKGLRAHPDFEARIDHRALSSYLQCSYVPAPLSIYQKTFKVLPGHYVQLSLDNRSLQSVAYWSHVECAQKGQRDCFRGTEKQAVSRLKTILNQSVADRLLADVPLGAFLSGGIDSSLLVALMQSQSSRPVKTFTIGFEESAFNEAHYAQAVADYLGTAHTVLCVSAREAQSVIPALATLYDEPFADVSQIPSALLSRLARQSVTVALSGDGGDEFFAGYHRHYWLPRLWRSIGWLPSVLKALLLRGALAFQPVLACLLRAKYPRIDNKLYKLMHVLKQSTPAAMYQCLTRTWASSSELMLASDFLPDLSKRHFFSENHLDWVHQMLLTDACHYLPDDLLVKMDRASMAVGLEVRSPFLDRRVIHWAWRLPLSYKIRSGTGKYLLKSLLSQYVPRSLTERPKMGFAVPMDQWLRGGLKEWAWDYLNQRSLSRGGYFKVDVIHQKWQEHQSGQRDWGYCLWAVLMFQQFLAKQRE